jgi:pyruvate dehydrogenase E2 component (dihydrolipoamide acetyltransferase)
MATAVIMPKAGMSMETGTVVRWFKKVGEQVNAGEPLLEITTDKVDMEVEAETSGILVCILKDHGEVPVTEPIGYLGTADELGKSPAELGPAAPPDGAAPPPAAGPGPAPGAEGDPAAGGRSPAAGGGGVLGTPAARRRAAELGLDLSRVAPSGTSGEVKLRDVVAAAERAKVRASPLARRVAELEGRDLAAVTGTGPGGRILRADLGAPAPAAPVPAAPGGKPGETRTPVSGKRKVIAERLSHSKFTAPHYYLRVAVGVDGLLAARAAAGAGGRKPSLNAFLLKYAAEAILRYPALNTSWEGDAIVAHPTVDIGLAVAQPDGLITPVVRDCGAKGVMAIEAELQPLVEKALSGKLLPAEYGGASFTISNLGSFGVDEFTAIINPPGSAILAVGAIRKEPVVGEDGAVVVRSRMRLTLSCDHRVIDGAVGARFLRFLADAIEDPSRLLL